MSEDAMTMMLKMIRKSIDEVRTSAGEAPERALTRVLAHLWSAHDELELCRRDGKDRPCEA